MTRAGRRPLQALSMAMNTRRTLSVCEVNARSKSEEESVNERELVTLARWYRQAKKKLFMSYTFQSIQAIRHMDGELTADVWTRSMRHRRMMRRCLVP